MISPARVFYAQKLFRKTSIQMITLIARFRLIPMKANYETKRKEQQ
jgi:hypothetical protein